MSGLHYNPKEHSTCNASSEVTSSPMIPPPSDTNKSGLQRYLAERWGYLLWLDPGRQGEPLLELLGDEALTSCKIEYFIQRKLDYSNICLCVLHVCNISKNVSSTFCFGLMLRQHDQHITLRLDAQFLQKENIDIWCSVPVFHIFVNTLLEYICKLSMDKLGLIISTLVVQNNNFLVGSHICLALALELFFDLAWVYPSSSWLGPPFPP